MSCVAAPQPQLREDTCIAATRCRQFSAGAVLGLQQHCGWNAVLQLLDVAFKLLGVNQGEYQRSDICGQWYG